MGENEWFDIYNGLTLENGTKVEQLSVYYDFRPSLDSKNKTSMSVYFETNEGGMHQICKKYKTLLLIVNCISQEPAVK